ncbi:MAG: alpha/beta hydrolase [Deltaproteobacteria bacterium]|nr:alpha/beta hydrolase [Deltaproteobacteria bacterium]
MHHGITVLKKGGKGRSFVILHEQNRYFEFSNALFETLTSPDSVSQSKALLLSTEPITNSNWLVLSNSFRELINSEGLRQASFISFGAASSITLHLALQELKLVRSLILVDSATRPHPTLFSRIIDKLESFLPLGLPLRSLSKGFDAKSFLQRVRCPVLVVNSAACGAYLRAQAQVFHKELPTGWLYQIAGNDDVRELTSMVLDFQKVPAKAPQKNVA